MIKPMFDNIILKPIKVETETKAKIYLPQQHEADKKDQKTQPFGSGEVIAIGPDAKQVELGMLVDYRPYDFYEIRTPDGPIRVLRESNCFVNFELDDFKKPEPTDEKAPEEKVDKNLN